MVFGNRQSVLFIEVSLFQGVVIRGVPLYIILHICIVSPSRCLLLFMLFLNAYMMKYSNCYVSGYYFTYKCVHIKMHSSYVSK